MSTTTDALPGRRARPRAVAPTSQVDRSVGGGKGTVAEWQQAMGIDWTDSRVELAEAIPPAYTSDIGAQLLAHLEAVAA